MSKQKAEELSSSDCQSELASRRPAPGNLFDDGLETQGTTGELAAQSCRHFGSTEGRLADATVVAVVTSLQQPSGLHRCPAKGSVPTESAASSGAAARSISLVNMSGPLCGMLMALL